MPGIFVDIYLLIASPKLLNATCQHSGCWGFIISECVKYVTYMLQDFMVKAILSKGKLPNLS